MVLSRTFALVVIVALALSGCTADKPIVSPSLTPPADSGVLLNPELQPVELPLVTAATAQAEGTRIADALQSLIADSDILNVSDESQLVPADDDLQPYYAVYRTIALDPSVDCLVLAETLTSALDGSGWNIFESTTEGGVFVAALSGGPEVTSWFAIIGGDASIAGQSTVTFQIASPDVQ